MASLQFLSREGIRFAYQIVVSDASL